jgi:hypothetical protein
MTTPNPNEDPTQQVTYDYPAYSHYVETPSQPQFRFDPPVPEREPTKKPWLVVGAVLVAVIAIVVAIWAVLNKDSDTLSASGTTAEAPPFSIDAPETLNEWRKRMAPVALAVGDDMKAAGAAADIEDYEGLHQACNTLSVDLAAWETYLPSPDPQITKEVQAGVDAYQDFTILCVRITPSSTRADGLDAASHIEAGNAHIQTATMLLNARGA